MKPVVTPGEPSFDVQKVQRLRKIVVLAFVVAVLAAIPFVGSRGELGVNTHEILETVGLCAIFICIIGRSWCSLYIGGRKKAEVVQTGPYSICRNPLYLFSFLGTAGIGAQTGSFVITGVFVVAAVVLFYAVVGREERWLYERFGEVYETYKARTPRFLPKLRLWRDEASLVVDPRFFLRTVGDGLIFVLAVPLFEGVSIAQSTGLIDIKVPLL